MSDVSELVHNEEDMSSWSKEELMNRIRQLDAHVRQLKNVIAKQQAGKSCNQQRKREFDFTKYKKRHVALKFLYLGWDYQGLAAQEDTCNTIEAHLFDALGKTRLIESRQTSNYHRCGRTDKGVSAFCQVISLDLRSSLQEGEDLIEPEGYTKRDLTAGENAQEIRYTHILNRVLPSNIRMIAWAPVKPAFSARFSCYQRTYKYLFPAGCLDINKMKEAAAYLVGGHDFRNFCKMDSSKELVNFRREIKSICIEPVSRSDDDVHGYGLFELTITGNAFLWHQIRCIVAILFLVGQGKEDPQIVKELLDIEKHPRKPQYSMASELPLVLFDCQFDALNWQYDKEVLRDVIKTLQEHWTCKIVKATLVRKMLKELETLPMLTAADKIIHQTEALEMGVKSKVYKPLLERPSCRKCPEETEQPCKKAKLDEDSDKA